MVSLELILGFNVQAQSSDSMIRMCRKGNGNMPRQNSSSMFRFNVLKNVLNKFTGSNYKFNLIGSMWLIYLAYYL